MKAKDLGTRLLGGAGWQWEQIRVEDGSEWSPPCWSERPGALGP